MKYLGIKAKNTKDCSPTLWVSQLCARKGTKRAIKDGVDWGFTTKSPGAIGLDSPILLSKYWENRFKKYAIYCGYPIAEFIEKDIAI